MQRRNGRDSKGARRRTAEQVGVAKVGMHEIGTQLGKLPADGEEGPWAEVTGDPDQLRLDAGSLQLGRGARGATDLLEIADA